MKSKIMFGITALLLIGSFFIVSEKVNAEECYLTNNSNICISEEYYNNLINLGFTDYEIRVMPQDEYNKNANLNGQVVSSVTNYYMDTYYNQNGEVTSNSTLITEEEYNNGIYTNSSKVVPVLGNSMGVRSYDGYVETTYKKETTKIVVLGSGNRRYKNTLEWKIIPQTRSYDIIAIGMDDDKVHFAGTRGFLQSYTYQSGESGVNSYPTYKTQPTGIGASFKLQEGDLSSLQSYLYYDVTKNDGVGTITSLYAYGDYAHATSNVTASQAANNYNVGSGISLSTLISSYYDTMASTVAYWSGSW